MTDPHRPDLPDRDPALDAAWKSHSTELPPPHVDAAILAAAHREARTRPHAIGDDDGGAHARGPSRAWWGLAAAATIGAIAFSVLQLAPPPDVDPPVTVATDIPRVVPEPAPPPRETPAKPAEAPHVPRAPVDAPTSKSEPPRSAAAASAPGPAPAPASRADAAKTTPKSTEQPLARVDRRDRQRESPADVAVPATRALAETPASSPAPAPDVATPAPRPFPGGPSLAAAPPPPVAPFAARSGERAKSEAGGSAADGQRRESAERPAAAAATQAPASPPRRAQADAASQAAAATPAPKLAALSLVSWIERIRTLHADQRFDDAARELNRFRDAYPDADLRLPAELRIWAASIRRN